MSEQLNKHSPELDKQYERSGEKDGSKAERQQQPENKQEQGIDRSREKLDDLLRSAQEKAKKSTETAKDLDADQSTTGVQPQLVSTDLQKTSLKQTLTRVQRKLPFDQKALSKFVHKPIVDTVSNAAEKTVARPSGLLVGGIFSLVFSLFTLWLSYFFGYDYNYLMSVASFIGGFAIGLVLEMLVSILTRKKRI